MIAEKTGATVTAPQEEEDPTKQLATGPPELKPLLTAPINFKASQDAKFVFDTIGKLAGLTVIYDPDFPARRITVDLNNATLQQALDITALESKAIWKPVTCWRPPRTSRRIT